MSDELVDKQLSRLQGLMHPDRTKIALEKAEPDHTPEDLGALAAVGYRSHNPDIHVSVYIFSSWSKHQPVSQQLKEEFAADGVHVVTATNGPMLFFGHTRTDGPHGMNARFALGDIVSAFSGDE